MAAVTVVSRYDNVAGSTREVQAIVNIASSGDTWNSGLSVINSCGATGGSAAVTSITKSGGTITFTTGGAVNAAFVYASGF